MLKRVLFIGFMLGFAWSANAQVATPVFDNGFPTYSAAATGWRQNSSIAVIYLNIEGDVKYDGTKIGEVKAGAAAEGDPDGDNVLPSIVGVYKAETLGAEFYTRGLKTDFKIDMTMPLELSPGTYTTGALAEKIYKEDKGTRLQLSYILVDSLSLGLGYRQLGKTVKQIDVITSTHAAFTNAGGLVQSSEVTRETNETAMGITASWQIAELLYLALGMESVTLTGSSRTVQNASASSPTASDTKVNYVDNAWTNMIFGVGMLTGEPGNTQFRFEYSMISSPESKKEASGLKIASVHPKTTLTYMNLEAKFGDFFVSARNEKEVEEKVDNREGTITTNWMGLGWQPESGISVSVYSYASEIIEKDSNGEVKFLPAGYRINVGFNF